MSIGCDWSFVGEEGKKQLLRILLVH